MGNDKLYLRFVLGVDMTSQIVVGRKFTYYFSNIANKIINLKYQEALHLNQYNKF